MHVFSRIEDFYTSQRPIILTIGNFDGVHQGHQFILQNMKRLAGPQGHVSVITFSNHPSEILRPNHPTLLLSTLSHKIKLLEQLGINSLLILPFTSEIAEQTAEHFVKTLRRTIPFSYLMLGHDATLGKNRQGNKETMSALAQQLGFEVHYAEEYRQKGFPVSSTEVRKHIQQGHLDEAHRLLGRPYSIYSIIESGAGKGREIGYPTLNLATKGLCLPPFGVYTVTIRDHHHTFQGIANLGKAPTIKNSQEPVLEVHILSSFNQTLDRAEIEVIFHQFLREEKRFDSVESLQKQIQSDVDFAKTYFNG